MNNDPLSIPEETEPETPAADPAACTPGTAPATVPAAPAADAASAPKKAEGRIDLIDAARGVAIILMVIHHFLYDLVAFLGMPLWLFTNPVLDVLHYFFAGLFIFLAGISSDFSRNNWLRGLKTLAAAALVTLVTMLMGMDIWFGILHMMAVCILFFALTRPFWEWLPRWLMPLLCTAGTVLTAPFVNGVQTDIPGLFMFGLITPDFYSSDYFPLLPWIFVFLLGTWAGRYVKEKRLPSAFYETRVPVLAPIGRRTLLIFLLHQPVLYGIVMIIRWFAER